MSDTNILLSIIITCFNYDRYIATAIDSALSQKMSNVEIIVVDDGSCDNSWSVITSYGSAITAIKIENQGQMQSSLRGFLSASGAFIYFLDGDDYLKNESLSQILGLLTGNISKVQFMLTPVDQFGDKIGHPFPDLKTSTETSSLIRSINLRGYYSSPPTSGNIFHRSVFDHVFSNTKRLNYERGIDGVALLLAPFIGNVLSLDRPLAYYRVHSANQSAFSVLTSSRMDGYRNRFIARIDHLDEILNSIKIDRIGFSQTSSYSYAREMQILSRIISHSRPSYTEILLYRKSISKEFSQLRSIVMLVFVLFILISPRKFALDMIEFRINQGKYSRVRSLLKKIALLLGGRSI